MKTLSVLFALLASSLLAGNAVACSDSLYRVGKGVAYRTYTAPLPGSVLVYGKGEGAETLARELERSGHGVRIVAEDNEFRAVMASGIYDVVIAAYHDEALVELTSSSTANSPTFLPIAMNTAEKEQARHKYERVMVAGKDEIKHYLKAIHQALKQRS